MNLNKNLEATFTTACDFNEDTLNQLFGITRNQPKEFVIYTTKKVQNRTHRKHRINKKWAKRYGFHDAIVKQISCDTIDIKNVNGVFVWTMQPIIKYSGYYERSSS